MDDNKRTNRYFFWRRVLLNLTVIGLVYILWFRPAQSYAVRKIILPSFDWLNKQGGDIYSELGIDEFFLSSGSNAFPRVKIEIPFNGYFWLAMALIWSAKNRRFGRVIWLYNWALFLIIPFVALGILGGFTWLAPLANVHEKIYKALFLILGILSVKEADTVLKNNN
ncbi:MAG: hypothetical protein ACE5D0_03490 [Fidelibacterota bacterium]